jgi:hypothetical protein
VFGPPAPDVDPRIVATLTKYFQGYKSGTDFGFLAALCAPKLDQFLLMKNTTVAAVQKTARAFFQGKDGLTYVPDLHSMKVETVAAQPDRTIARLPVEMRWSYPLPDELKTDTTPSYPGPPEIDRAVTVDVEITLDASSLITSYVEKHVRTPALRETREPGCRPDDDKEPLRIVYDLGETYVSQERFRGQDVMRHVRASDGDAWELDSTGFAVSVNKEQDCENLDAEDMAACVSATAAAWSQCLRPVGDGGR